MPLRVTNVRLPVTIDEQHIGPELARRLGVDLPEVTGWRLLKKSLDACYRECTRAERASGSPVRQEESLRTARISDFWTNRTKTRLRFGNPIFLVDPCHR